MTMSDPLSDMLTRLRNGQHAGKRLVRVPASKLRARVLKVLEREGFIGGFTQTQIRDGIAELEVSLRYDRARPVIRDISRVSKPGLRVYSGSKEIPAVSNGLGISIISTPIGVLADHEAREKNVGGEILCRGY
ncbi:MAG: 30S ribosomal protein S8 [Alphaproteobacteria bacterium]|nr:30S ribosomal protein S8 [Alphaproteobacteria bacterium]